ncbi:MAG: rod-binding protein [Desulfobacterales bacterium]|nr:rod-binding protein [Desulfobacterales bacterium]
MNLSIDPRFPPQPAAPATPAERRKSGDDPALAKACRDFEAIFLQALFKGMRATAIEGGLFEKGNDQEMFQDLMDMELAKSAASRNMLGIGRALFRDLQDQR